jgi:phenylacetate-CoA ligase
LRDLSALPILEKQHVRDDPDALRNPRYRGPVNIQVTTGSSGVPLRVVRSRIASAWGRAAKLRGHRWHGLREGEKEVRFGGVSTESFGRLRTRVSDLLMNRVRVDVADLSDVRLAGCLDLVRRVKPVYLYGYPSAIAHFARFVESAGGGRNLGVRLVLCSSERLYDHRREIIARVFGCPVFDEYGAAEVSILAMECPLGGLHQAAENVHVEIVDANCHPVPDGEEGRVIVTDLNNRAAPLVRYGLGDRGRIIPRPCRCGRKLPLLEVTAGSSFGIVSLADGRTISGAAFYFLAEGMILSPASGLREIVIFRRGERFRVRAIPRPGGSTAHLQELRSRLQELLGPSAIVDVEQVDRIERHGGDKYRILIEELL